MKYEDYFDAKTNTQLPDGEERFYADCLNRLAPILQQMCRGANIDVESEAAEAASKAWDKARSDGCEYPFAYARKCAVHSVIDKISKEKHVSYSDEIVSHAASGEVPPVDERERRERQAAALSDALRDFVRFVEENGKWPARRRREVIERFLHGQEYDEIEASMETSGGVSRDTLYSDKIIAKNMIKAAASEHDPYGSLLFTILGALPIGEDALRYTPSKEALADARRLPDGKRSMEVFAWVVKETTALCPSRERLEQYAANQDCEEFRDMRYHVEERACSYCRDVLAASQ